MVSEISVNLGLTRHLVCSSAMAHTPRNKRLPGGIPRYSRSVMYRKKALYKKKKVPVKPETKKRPYYKRKPVKGEKNGKDRVVLLKKSVSF